MSTHPSAPWTADDTEEWLRQNPLPTEFRWEKTTRNPDGSKTVKGDQRVLPEYRISKGYGFWLRTTPYFPGLFEEIHAVMLSLGEKLPYDSDHLAQLLLERNRAREVQQDLWIETTDGPMKGCN